MKRKVIQQGKTTLTMTLPISWVKRVGIRAGQEVDVQEEDTSLIISTKDSLLSKKKEELTISEGSYDEVYDLVSNAYKGGVDELTILLSSQSKLKMVKKVVKRLIGFQLVAESNQKCVVEMIAEPGPEKETALLRRLFLLQKTVFEALQNFLENRTKEQKEQVVSLFDEVQPLTNLVRRMLQKNSQFATQSYANEYLIVQRLACLSSSCRHLVNVLQSNSSTNKKTKDAILDVIQIYDFFYEALFQKKGANVAKVRKSQRLAIEKLHSLLATSSGEQNVIFSYCLLMLFEIGRSLGAASVVANKFKS